MLSASILESMDTTQDPCDNFYGFASQSHHSPVLSSVLLTSLLGGGWVKSHPIPSGKGSYGSFTQLAEQNRELVKEIVESVHVTSSFDEPADDQLLRKVRDFYKSCTDEDRLDDLGTEPLIQVVQTVRKLFRGNSTKIGVTGEEDAEDRKKGLTAALSFLHTRGAKMQCCSH
jgi:endothelin-converting enzyme